MIAKLPCLPLPAGAAPMPDPAATGGWTAAQPRAAGPGHQHQRQRLEPALLHPGTTPS